MKRRWRRLVCRVRRHRLVPSTVSWWQRAADGPWEQQVQPGPLVCGRCGKTTGRVRIRHLNGDVVHIDSIERRLGQEAP